MGFQEFTRSRLDYFIACGKAVKYCRADAILAEGKELHSGRSMRLFYYGKDTGYAWLFNKIFSEYEIMETRKNVIAINAIRLAKDYEKKSDILVLDFRYFYNKLAKLLNINYICIPPWVGQKLEIGMSRQDLLNHLRKDHGTKSMINKIEKSDVSHRIVDKEENYLDFYHNYYLPFSRKRFGEAAVIEIEKTFLRMCSTGIVMQILYENEVKAYALMELKNECLSLHWSGITENIGKDIYRTVCNALYYFPIMFAFEIGCREVDYLYASPCMNDGVYKYKRNWGSYVYSASELGGGIFIKPMNLDIQVANIFVNNYFITNINDRLVAKILCDDGKLSPGYIEKIIKEYYSSGIKAIRIYSLKKVNADVKTWLSENVSPVEVVDLSDEKSPHEVFCR